MFSVEVARPAVETIGTSQDHDPADGDETGRSIHQTGMILVIEDDPDLRELLEVSFKNDGHEVTAARDGVVALDLVTREAVTSAPFPDRPGVIVGVPNRR